MVEASGSGQAPGTYCLTRSSMLKAFLRFLLPVVSIFVWSQSNPAQQPCLNQDDVKKMLARVTSGQDLPLNNKLREELLKLRYKNQQRLYEDVIGNRKPDAMMKRIKASREKNTNSLCPILKQYGWPTPSLVSTEGVEAALFLLNNSVANLRVDMVPVIVAATKQGDIANPDFASYIDGLRVDAGLKQLFGTQATVINGFLVLFPIEAETHVDSRRKQ